MKSLNVLAREVRLDTVLKCGQSFRWHVDANQVYRCALRGRVITLKQDAVSIMYEATFPTDWMGHDDTETLLRDYLNLHIDLEPLYERWSLADPHFKTISKDFLGVRMLRQDPFENLLCFICSSNNNIARITLMVNNLCKRYGRYIATIEGREYHDFPTLDALLHPSFEEELRELGFGYRANYVAHTALQLASKPASYLLHLRTLPYAEAHAELCSLKGVGAKVADCVCLMSLDKTMAVPVDTHVWQIALRDYKFRGVKGTTMTKAAYGAVGAFFVALWGEYAGWAHTILFAADLRTFKVPPQELVQETTVNEEEESVKMEEVKMEEVKMEEVKMEEVNMDAVKTEKVKMEKVKMQVKTEGSKVEGHVKLEDVTDQVINETVILNGLASWPRVKRPVEDLSDRAKRRKARSWIPDPPESTIKVE